MNQSEPTVFSLTWITPSSPRQPSIQTPITLQLRLDSEENFFFLINYLFIYLFIYFGCVGSSFLCEGFP